MRKMCVGGWPTVIIISAPVGACAAASVHAYDLSSKQSRTSAGTVESTAPAAASYSGNAAGGSPPKLTTLAGAAAARVKVVTAIIK